MPGLDGTGPRGMGPMTGGGRGFCALPLTVARAGYWGRPRYTIYSRPTGVPYYGSIPFTTPLIPRITREQEIDFLRNQAEAMSEELEQIEARIQELESNQE